MYPAPTFHSIFLYCIVCTVSSAWRFIRGNNKTRLMKPINYYEGGPIQWAFPV